MKFKFLSLIFLLGLFAVPFVVALSDSDMADFNAAMNFGEKSGMFDAAYGSSSGGFIGGIMAFLLGSLIIAAIIFLPIYIYMSFAYMKIANRLGQTSPGIAWIPIVGPALISAKAANMHWWPVLLLIGAIIPFLGLLFSLAFAVFMIIWTWKMYQALGRPGWWAILIIIPLLGMLIHLILIGIAAWGNAPGSMSKK